MEKDFPLLVDLLSDIYRNSLFDEAELDREKGVILQEILMVDDTPEEYLHDFFNAVVLGRAPAGVPRAGDARRAWVGSTGPGSWGISTTGSGGAGIVVTVVGNLPHDDRGGGVRTRSLLAPARGAAASRSPHGAGAGDVPQAKAPRAGAPVPGRPRRFPAERADLRDGRAERDPRGQLQQPPLPAGPRGARAGVLRRIFRVRLRGRRRPRHLRRHGAGERRRGGLAVAGDVVDALQRGGITDEEVVVRQGADQGKHPPVAGKHEVPDVVPRDERDVPRPPGAARRRSSTAWTR